MDVVAGALTKDIERALAAHSRHITLGALFDAWKSAPERLRAASAQADVDALYTELRNVGRWDSRDITAGAALAALNALLTRVKGLKVAPPVESEPEAP